MISSIPSAEAVGNYSTTSPFSCGENCNNGYEIPGGYSDSDCYANPGLCFNTIDDCWDGTDYTWEFVNDITITDLNASIGGNFSSSDIIQVDAQVDCAADGDTIQFIYNNGTDWVYKGSQTCQEAALITLSQNITLDPVEGNHSVRVLILLGMMNPEMICGYEGDYQYSDSDDVSFEVHLSIEYDPPSVTPVSPSQGSSFLITTPLPISLNVSASDVSGVANVTANVTYPDASLAVVALSHTEGVAYSGTLPDASIIGRYNVTFIATDTYGNVNATETTYFNVISANISIEEPLHNTITNQPTLALSYLLPEDSDVAWTGYVLNSVAYQVLDRFTLLVNGTNADDTPPGVMESSENESMINMSFLTTRNMTISNVGLSLRRSGPGTNSSVEIRQYNASSNSPASEVLAYAILAGDDALNVSNASFNLITLMLNGTLRLGNNTRYCVVLNSTSAQAAAFEWLGSSDYGYEDGNSTSNQSWDLYFRLPDSRRFIANITLSYGASTLSAVFNDSVGSSFSSSQITVTRDNSAPTIAQIVLAPSTLEGLDPGRPINVTAQVSDDLALSAVILKWKLFNDSSFTELPMTLNTTTHVANASFIPEMTIQTNYTIVIWANDTSGFDVSSEQNISVQFETSWNRTPDSWPAHGGPVLTQVAIGNITINNIGDLPLSFTIAPSADTSPTIDISNASFVLPAGSSETVFLNATTPSSGGEYNITINVSTPNSTVYGSFLTNTALFSNVSGVQFYAEILTYDPSVTQGDTKVVLSGRVTNVGTDTAYNVSLGWGLPSGWSPRRNVSTMFASIVPSQQKSFSLTVDINSSAPTGDYNLTLTALSVVNGTNISDQDSREVSVSAPSSVVIVTGSPGGGGGSVAMGAAAPRYEIEISAPETIDAIRGDNVTFKVTLKNPSSLISRISNITVSLDGFMRTKTFIDPGLIPELVGNASVEVSILLSIPSYQAPGNYPLQLSASFLQNAKSAKADTFSKTINLRIAGANRTVVSECLERADAYISRIHDEGRLPEALQMLFKDSYSLAISQQKSFLLTDAERTCEELIKDLDFAETLGQRINALQGNISVMQQELLQQRIDSDSVPSLDESSRALQQSIDAYSSGDLDKAERLLSTTEQLYRAAEQQRTSAENFSFSRLLESYGWILLVILLGFIIIGVSISRAKKMERLHSKLSSIELQESQIIFEKKELQHRFFKEHIESKRSFEFGMHKLSHDHAALMKQAFVIKLEIVKHSLKGITSASARKKQLEKVRGEWDALKRQLQRDFHVNRKMDEPTYRYLSLEVDKIGAMIEDVSGTLVDDSGERREEKT